MFFEQVKVISVETVDGRKVATIEASSQESLYSYHWRYSNEQKLINVRIPDSCPPAERDAMIEICNTKRGLHYIPGGNTNDDNEEEEGEKEGEKDDDDDDDDEGKNEEEEGEKDDEDDYEEEKNEEEGEKKEDHEKEGEKTRSSCCCN